MIWKMACYFATRKEHVLINGIWINQPTNILHAIDGGNGRDSREQF